MIFLTLDLRPRRRLLLGWGLALLVLALLALAPPDWVLPVAGRLSPIRQAPTREKVTALTFNISWGVEVPRRVLAALEEGGAKATFFVSGPWAASHPDLVREIAGGGHTVGSLGHRHVDLTTLSRQELADDLSHADRVLEAITGARPLFFRPPDGRLNDLVLETAGAMGYTVVTWRTDSLDWRNPPPEKIARRVLARVAPGDIVLLNASDSARQTDRALPAILDGLERRGYRAVTLTELLAAESD
ncbi:MAG: polysaccharide deacetylase family protein [bacterium]|nr:polysaccharide deacetylase family protein [bacterium]